MLVYILSSVPSEKIDDIEAKQPDGRYIGTYLLYRSHFFYHRNLRTYNSYDIFAPLVRWLEKRWFHMVHPRSPFWSQYSSTCDSCDCTWLGSLVHTMDAADKMNIHSGRASNTYHVITRYHCNIVCPLSY